LELDLDELIERVSEAIGLSSPVTQANNGCAERLRDAHAEAVAQIERIRDQPGQLITGINREVGSSLATPFSVLTPTFYFGKGFGDLPDTMGWARSFAVTGQIGYQFPTRSFDVVQGTFIPQVLVYGMSLQYSLPYLKSEVIDLELPDFINHLIPIVEAQLSTPVANNFGNSSITTGTINPGVIWVGSYFQVGVEAIIPVNRESGSAVGVIGQLHLYLDDMFPTTIGRPPLGGTSTPPRQLTF
jgi:hypothetical protein